MEVVRKRVAGVEVAAREAGAGAPREARAGPVLYIHGVPDSAEMWEPFLERTGGTALDLPGFGDSDKPAAFDYSVAGYRAFLREYTEGLERFSLVMHDWGAVGLALAMDRPEAIDRIVLLDAVPFLPGYRWHRIARVWRTPVAGELFMGFATKRALGFLARREGDLPRDVVDAQVERVWKHFDHGTQRAILRLYRSAPEEELERLGAGLGQIRKPALVVWGRDDPYIDSDFAHAYAGALGGSSELVAAGHWPWLEDPSVIARVASFLAA